MNREEWDLVRHLAERFSQVEIGCVPRMTDAWRQSGTSTEEIDRWLAARAAGGSLFWVKQRVRFRTQLGTQDELLDELMAAVKADPTNADKAILYLDALQAANTGPKPIERPVAWMGEVCKPDSAGACYELGKKFRQHKDGGRPACVLFERSLTLPFAEDDYRIFSTQRGGSQGEVERGGRLWTKVELMECYRVVGKSEEAAKLAEELQKGNPDPWVIRRAAEAMANVQPAPSGLREEEAKAANANTPQYWHARAEYYMGRKEYKDAEAAFKKALDLSPFEPRPKGKGLTPIRVQVLSGYCWNLKQQDRQNDAIALMRNELAIAPPDSATNGTAMDELLEMDNAVPRPKPKARPSGTPATSPAADAKKPWVIDPKDDFLWTCLGKFTAWDAMGMWGNTENQLLLRMVEKVPSDQRDGFWQKAEKLTRDTDPRRAKVLGEVMNQMHESARAIPLLKDAVARLALYPYNKYNDLEFARLHLFEAYIDSGDWREAERIWPEARQVLSGDRWNSKYGEIVLAAAKDGDRDDALRMWKQWANADLASSLGNLKKLCDAGLREPLREYYAGIGKRLPASWVPVQAMEILSSTKPGE